MRRFFLVFTLLAALGVSSARADETSHRKAVMELFTQTNMPRVLNSSMEAALKLQIQNNPAIARFEAQLRAFFLKYMSWDSLKEDFTTLYMKTFTEAELKQLVAFYKTPVGQKSLNELPSLMQQGAQLGMARVQAHMDELQAMLKEPPASPPETKPAPAKPAPAKPAK